MLKQILDAYTGSLRRLGRKRSSVKQAEHHAGKLLAIMGPEFPSALAVERFVAQRLAERKSPASINGSLRVLRAAFKYAERTAGFTKLPHVQMLKAVRKPPSILTEPELEKLLTWGVATREETLLYAALELAAYAGLRHSEILHLTWADANGSEIRVTAKDWEAPSPDGGLPIKRSWCPKSYQERSIPMHPRVERILASVARITMGWEGVDMFPASFIFTDDDGKHIQSMRYPVAEAFSKIGVTQDRKPGFHMLRRTFASRLLQTGTDIESVRDLMGHADIHTTMAYVSTTTALKRAAIGRL